MCRVVVRPGHCHGAEVQLKRPYYALGFLLYVKKKSSKRALRFEVNLIQSPVASSGDACIEERSGCKTVNYIFVSITTSVE